jgi:hypothetical protein
VVRNIHFWTIYNLIFWHRVPHPDRVFISIQEGRTSGGSFSAGAYFRKRHRQAYDGNRHDKTEDRQTTKE